MSQRDYLEIAWRIGARLCRDAIWSGNRCNWVGCGRATFEGEDRIVYRALPPALYSGTSGVAVFLHRLHQATGEPIFRDTADGALRQALSAADEVRPEQRAGYYSGWTGLLRQATAMESEIAGRGLEMARALCALPPSDSVDVISGSAGGVASLLEWGRATGEPCFAEAALRHGERLLPAAANRNYTGFAHGATGFAWALLALFRATGDERFGDAAQQALAYAAGGDVMNNRNPMMRLTWCYGASGNGLVWMRAWEILERAEYREQARACVATVAELLPQVESDCSLCHGAAGAADFLLEAAARLDDPECLEHARAWADEAAERHESSGELWPCGIPDGDECPDLMLGLAGIGHVYLRLAEPGKFGTVLAPG